MHRAAEPGRLAVFAGGACGSGVAQRTCVISCEAGGWRRTIWHDRGPGFRAKEPQAAACIVGGVAWSLLQRVAWCNEFNGTSFRSVN